ncbi:MAG: hypothetical protein AB7P69_23555 [Candidatus Binatia bacterium]
MTKRTSTHHTKSFHRPALSPFLYDLGAATRTLPPAAVLPEQFYGSPVGAHASRGEVALMRAVLEDAIECFQKQSRKSGRRAQRLAREAKEWLFTDDQQWPFSFLNICHVLDIDPGYIRRGLKQFQKEQLLLDTPQRRETTSLGFVPIAA